LKKYRGIFLKNQGEIELLREANRIVAEILDAIEAEVAPDVKTMLFEEIAQDMCRSYGVKPAFQGYHGFPYAVCCSINEEIVHGFPSSRRLDDGDIVSIDMGVFYEGFCGDSARTFTVGEISDTAKRLLEVTHSSLESGIRQARPGNKLYDVSRAIQETVESAGFSVVRRFVGHGIGRRMHEKPEIPNFVPQGMPDIPLKTGMTMAIEPMVCENSSEVEILDDKWTAVTKDGGLSAHFEHTVVVTSEGPEILSVNRGEKAPNQV
jgi:methionyl aminopeptidase